MFIFHGPLWLVEFTSASWLNITSTYQERQHVPEARISLHLSGNFTVILQLEPGSSSDVSSSSEKCWWGVDSFSRLAAMAQAVLIFSNRHAPQRSVVVEPKALPEFKDHLWGPEDHGSSRFGHPCLWNVESYRLEGKKRWSTLDTDFMKSRFACWRYSSILTYRVGWNNVQQPFTSLFISCAGASGMTTSSSTRYLPQGACWHRSLEHQKLIHRDDPSNIGTGGWSARMRRWENTFKNLTGSYW